MRNAKKDELQPVMPDCWYAVVMRNVAIAMLCLASVWNVPALARGADTTADPKPATPGRFNARLHRDGEKSLPYQLLIPRDYTVDDGKAWPLIVWLHGSGEKGTDNKAPISRIGGTFLSDGAKARAFVLVPQCMPDEAWHANGLNKQPPVSESSRLLILALADVVKEFKLDDRRIVVGGFSMGAIGTWELLARFPGVFAASFPICGAAAERPALPPLVKDVPVWAFNGDKDAYVSVEQARQVVNDLKALGSPIKYTEYPDVGHQHAQALADPKLLEWILEQRRTKPADFTEAKVPDGATIIIRTMPAGTRDTWTGPLSKTLHGRPRVAIGGVRYSLRPAKTAAPDVAAALEKIGKGELKGDARITGTVELEDLAWLAVEMIEPVPAK